MRTKFLSFFLTLALITVSLLSFACGGKETGENEGTTAADETKQEESTTAAKILPDLPEDNFKGYEFKILTKGQFNVHWKSRDIYAESETGEPINDAVYLRNLNVIDKYNIKIKEVDTFEDYEGAARKSILAQADEYDMISIGVSNTGTLAASGYLVDLHKIEFMDFTKPWYDQNANKQLSIMNKLYVTVGDMIIMDNDATWVVLFNKRIAQELGLDDLYKLVNEGKWTQERMYEASKLAAKDLNGDGVMDESDRWGMEGESYNTYALCVAAGGSIVAKDENDMPYFTVGDQRMIDTYQKVIPMQTDYEHNMLVWKFSSRFTEVWGDLMDKTFADGRSLFNFAGLNRATLFRSMETDFGILPVPKFDEEQSEYHCVVSQWCSNGIAVPQTASDLRRTGIIIEALSAESMYTLTPAYYDISLKTKSTRDDESGAMLDLIFKSRMFDLGYMFAWGDFAGMMSQMTEKGDSNIVSAIEKKMPAAEKAMQKTIDSLSEIE